MNKRPSPLTIFFIAFIFGFGYLSLPFTFSNIYSSLRLSILPDWRAHNLSFGTLTSAFDKAVLSNFNAKSMFIDRYGELSLIQDKRIINDVVSGNEVYRTSDNQLVWVINSVNYDLGMQRLVQFKSYLDDMSIPLLYVNAPVKTEIDSSTLPYGIKDQALKNKDLLLKLLEENSTPFYDLRETMLANNMKLNDVFYRTDHHWKVETGLWVAGKIMTQLNNIINIGPDMSLYNAENYAVKNYESWFLGSLGKRVGSTYVKPDDFNLLTPKFETNFTLEFPSYSTIQSGTFDEALLFEKYIKTKDYYRLNPYQVYLAGDQDLTLITNHNAINKPSILVVKDSYADVVIPFMANGFSHMTIVDLRYMKSEKLPDIVKRVKPDVVMIFYNVRMLSYADSNNFMGE